MTNWSPRKHKPAVDTPYGTNREDGFDPFSHKSALVPFAHQILARWKLSSLLEPTGEETDHENNETKRENKTTYMLGIFRRKFGLASKRTAKN